MRRLFGICGEPWSFPQWNGDLKNRFSGYYTFREEKCTKELDIVYENKYRPDDEYIPLLRDPYGRITPVSDTLEYRKCKHYVYSSSEPGSTLSVEWEMHNWGESEFRPKARTRDKKYWNKLADFQKELVERVESTKDFSAYLALDTGCGKTVVTSSLIRENFEKFRHILIIVEANDIFRWQAEVTKWMGVQELMMAGNLAEGMERIPQIVDKNTKNFSFARIAITSWTNISNDEFREWLFSNNFDLIISDEAHMFKDPNSKRTQGFIEACSKIPHKIFLSATFLENKIKEIFVPLNILSPRHFPSMGSLLRYCVFDARGKSYSLKASWRDHFFETISPYFFRVTKEQAGLKFPYKRSYSVGNKEPIWYDPQKFKSNTVMIHEYNQQLDLLEQELRSTSPSIGTIIGFMSSLRHITGKMKVMNCAEHALMWLMANEGKLCIGVHHKSVMEWLKVLLTKAGYKVLTMSDETAKKKDEIEKKWKTDPAHRVLIASILGAGKGRNFQFCQNAILLERQWNKSKELQFEGRFHRVMVDENDNIRTHFTEEDDVNIDYIMGRGTFDEYFDDLVRLKGVIVDSADESIEDSVDTDTVLSLARRMIETRLKYVGI